MLVSDLPDHLRALAESVAREALVRCGHDASIELPTGLIANIALRIMQHNAERIGMSKHDFRTVVETGGTDLNDIALTSAITGRCDELLPEHG